MIGDDETQRHDGSEIMRAEESVLAEGEDGLEPLGIRRWKLQKVLYEAALDAGIQIHFNKKITHVREVQSAKEETGTDGGSGANKAVEVQFADGTSIRTRLLLAADGSKSPTRSAVIAAEAAAEKEGGSGESNPSSEDDPASNNGSSSKKKPTTRKSKLTYTGTTCLYGTAPVGRDDRGLCLPTSETTKCHGAFFPVGEGEQCFQFHFPTPAEKKKKRDKNSECGGSSSSGGWTALLKSVGRDECRELADQLKVDGWHDKYLQPLYHADSALKVPFALLQPPLETFVYLNNRVVLLGDAAHPAVPYLGEFSSRCVGSVL